MLLPLHMNMNLFTLQGSYLLDAVGAYLPHTGTACSSQSGSPLVFEGYEDSGVTLMARILDDTGAAATQSSMSSVSYKVFDKSDNSTISSANVPVNLSFFDTLQSNRRWLCDTDGYNFKIGLPAGAFPDGGKTYRIEVLFTPIGPFPQFFGAWELTTVNVLTS